MTGKCLFVILCIFTGCVTSVQVPREQEVYHEQPATSLEDFLEMEIRRNNPGVRVHRSPSGIKLRIRGSLHEPLYVVDGIPHSSFPLGLHPKEIEKIEVITELARLSRYGMRGANGVVSISTKR